MMRREIGLFVLLCTAVVSTAQARSGAEEPAVRWEKTIQTFENWDRKNSFPADAILFVGSSSIRMWPTRECFEDFAVINRGFGGSQISDVNYYATRIVLRYEPKVIVFYAGDNDIAAGESAEQVVENYTAFIRKVHEKLPNTRIIFISIKPSGSRWSLWPVMSQANRMIEGLSEKDRRLYYFDAATPLINREGKPNLDLFLNDRLHLNPKGYKIWTRLLRPVLQEALKPQKQDER